LPIGLARIGNAELAEFDDMLEMLDVLPPKLQQIPPTAAAMEK
jgi:hypothetical protein